VNWTWKSVEIVPERRKQLKRSDEWEDAEKREMAHRNKDARDVMVSRKGLELVKGLQHAAGLVWRGGNAHAITEFSC
jgi:hypothetical protein